MTTRLKAKYLLWVTSQQGTAPYFQRVYPKHVAAIMRETGRDIKVTKRLPVHMQASDLEIIQALEKCNRDFENSIKAYTDPNNRKALHEHDVLKAALGLLEMHGLKPGDASYENTKALSAIEDMLGDLGKDHMVHGEVAMKVEDLLVDGTEDDSIVDVTVSEAFAMYMQAKPSPKYERVLERFLADVGNRVISQSINRHLHDWVHRELETRGVSTVSKDLSIIRAAMNYAIRANGINVVVHKPVMPEHETKARPVMSREELKALFALDLQDWERQCLVASLCTGAINSELKGMKVGDLSGTMLLRFPKGKTKFRERSVPVPFIERWRPIKVGEGRIRDRLTELIKSVNPDASPYSLRHSAEHYMTIAKVSETDRAAICGWANKGRFHQYGEAGKHNDERLLPLVDVMHETWDWLFN